MKRPALALLLISSIGLLSWGSAQSNRTDLYDAKKAQQEMEVMKGILSTTLGFVANELRSREASTATKTPTGLFHKTFIGGSWGGAEISAYYLYGQGATFVIPISSLNFTMRGSGRVFAMANDMAQLKNLGQLDNELNIGLVNSVEEANNSLEAAQEALQETLESQDQMRAMMEERLQGEPAGGVARSSGRRTARAVTAGGYGVGAGAGTGQAVSPPPPPPAPQAAPAPPATPRPPRAGLSSEDMRKKLADAQEKVKKRREELEARRQKLLQSLSEVKVFLVEALANHGDSLTFLKPGEYINIVLTTDEGMPLFSDSGESRSAREVVSVQKSVIVDYKAGRLTMEAFKQKVLQYSN